MCNVIHPCHRTAKDGTLDLRTTAADLRTLAEHKNAAE